MLLKLSQKYCPCDLQLCFSFTYSKFSDIYDEDRFISTLEGYVKVAKELPQDLMERYNYNISNIPNFRVQAWASASYYTEVVYAVLRSQGYVVNPYLAFIN